MRYVHSSAVVRGMRPAGTEQPGLPPSNSAPLSAASLGTPIPVNRGWPLVVSKPRTRMPPVPAADAAGWAKTRAKPPEQSGWPLSSGQPIPLSVTFDGDVPNTLPIVPTTSARPCGVSQPTDDATSESPSRASTEVRTFCPNEHKSSATGQIARGVAVAAVWGCSSPSPHAPRSARATIAMASRTGHFTIFSRALMFSVSTLPYAVPARPSVSS